MGTALIAQGLDLARETAASWNLLRPERVQRVHRAHVAAGAQLLLTNTFAVGTCANALIRRLGAS